MYVLDTSVIIEYIDTNGRFHKIASNIFSEINNGKTLAFIPHVILAETYYVAVRIYNQLGLSDSDKRAENLVSWLYSHPFIEIINKTLDLAIKAGKIKRELKLALTDCYVLAVSKIKNAVALFRKREREMLRVINVLTRKFNIQFLEDF